MKLLIILCSMLFTLSFLPVTAESHVLTKDDNVGAVIHIDPEDEPIAGKESIINVELKDKNNFFTYNNCTCTISISKNGKEFYSQSLERNENAGSIPFIFPETGEYIININGIPDDNESFPKFSLNQKITVTSIQLPTNTATLSPKNTNTSNVSNIYILFSIPIIGLILYLAYKKLKK